MENVMFEASHQNRTYNEDKYVRRESAIMHARRIENSLFPDENEMNDTVRSSHTGGTAMNLHDSEEKTQALSLFKQSRSQLMRDLRELGSKKVPKQKSSAGILTDGHQAVPLLESGPRFDYDLYVTDGIENSKQTHSSTKKKPSDIGQAYKNSRKDERRPLSKLCDDSVVEVQTCCQQDTSGQSAVPYPGHKLSNVFEPIRVGSAFSVDMNNCSYSSDTSSADTSIDASFASLNSTVKSVQVDAAESMTGFLNNHSDGDEFFDATYTMEDDILDEGHLHMHGLSASLKDKISKPKKKNGGYSKEHIPLIRDHRSSKKTSNKKSSKKKSISHKVHRVSLVSLMNTPFVAYPVPVKVLGGILGYPVPVEVFFDSHPAGSNLNLTEE